MPIKQLNSVPKTKRGVASELIEKDIQTALEGSIEAFEFISDKYNYATLPSTVRNVVCRIFKREVYVSVREKLIKKYIDESNPLFDFLSIYDSDKYALKVFSISSHDFGDRKHVYCSIDYNYLSNIEREVEKGTQAKYDKHIGLQKIKAARKRVKR